ncbi:MAG: hypothetical protein AAGE01_21300 [Pseudomonadota bacterium]
MITKGLWRPAIFLSASTLVLAACGGGSSSDGGAASPPMADPPPRVNISIEIAAQDQTLSANPGTIIFAPGTDFATQLNVNLSGPFATNQTVSFSVSNAERGVLSTDGDLVTQSQSLELNAVNGDATAVYHARGTTGVNTVTVSTLDDRGKADPGDDITRSATVDITIDNAVAPPQRLTLETSRTRLPANAFFVQPFLGSPYLSEVTITFLDRFGNLGAPEEGEAAASVDPVTIGAFSTLDDPSTEDVNEFLNLLGNGTVGMAAGSGTVFVHSFDIPGNATLRVVAQDPVTGDLFEETLDFVVVEPASDGIPANVILTVPASLLFIQDSGGRTATNVEIIVFDGANEPVADATASNNVRVEIDTIGAGDAVLTATDVSGAQVSGRAINVGTTAGITSANLRTGASGGTVRIRAIADAADNNVDNGIQAPVTDVFELEITDGEPFAVSLSAFQLGQQGINPVNDGVRLVNTDPTQPVPAPTGGAYQLPVVAVVTDRNGNPPARPVTVQFGLIDAPLQGFPATGPGSFAISGGDGDPQESGNLFTAPGGAFNLAGGGAAPGDTLVLFGRDSVGNSDLEGARSIDGVISNTQLTVTRPFDANVPAVDRGPVIPYAIGRPENGNILTSAVTDEFGVAAAVLTYPVSAVGRSVIVHGQVATVSDAGTIGDVTQGSFSALAPVILVASPNDMFANKTRTVELCAFDAAGVPIPGVRPSFAFSTHVGTAIADGQEDIGVVSTPTGFDGCTDVLVETISVPITGSGDFDFLLNFELGGVIAPVAIDGSVTDQNPINQIDILPEAIIGNTPGTDILVRLVDVNGNPIPGEQIRIDCTSNQGAVTPLQFPGVTDANGLTSIRLGIAGLDALCPGDTPGDGICLIDTTAVTANGEELSIVGREGFLLPDDPLCAGEVDEFTLTVNFFEVNDPPPTDPMNPTDGGNRGTPPYDSVIVFSDDGLIACEYDVENSDTPTDCATPTYPRDTRVTLSIPGIGGSGRPRVPFCAEVEIDDNMDGEIDENEEVQGCFLGWSGSEECQRAVDIDGFPLLRVELLMNRDKACTARFR